MTTRSARFLSHRTACGVAFALLALLTSCSKTDVVSYRVPKEKDATLPFTVAASSAPAAAPTPVNAGMAGPSVTTASGAGLTWTAPAAWQVKAPGAMRKGSFTIGGDAGATADLSITAFPGAVGGEFANVNRWRGQLGLAPIAEADLAGAVTRLSSNGIAFTVVDLAGQDTANPQRMLGAMAPYEGAMWFFKLTGPAALVAATKPAFVEFLQSVKIATP